MHSGTTVVSVSIISFFAILALAAPVVVSHDPNFQSRENRGNGGARLPPVWVAGGKAGYYFGTDALGRDILSRIAYGARVSMAVGVIPALIAVCIGVSVGLSAGYYGGRMGMLLMGLVDFIYTFPDLLLILVLVSVLRDIRVGSFLMVRLFGGLPLVFVVLALVRWVGIARFVRGQVLSLREKEFVEAARSIGASDRHIMLRHLLPNCLGPVIISATYLVPSFILTEAFLSYLGISVTAPAVSWGEIINNGYNSINSSPHEVWIPTICIGLLTFSFSLLADSLRDIWTSRA